MCKLYQDNQKKLIAVTVQYTPFNQGKVKQIILKSSLLTFLLVICSHFSAKGAAIFSLKA